MGGGVGISSLSTCEALIYAGVQAGQHWGVHGISAEGSTDSVHGFQGLLFLGSSRKYLCVAGRADLQSPVAMSNIPSPYPPPICSWGSAQPRYTDHKPAVASVPECISCCFSGDYISLSVFFSLQPSLLGPPASSATPQHQVSARGVKNP